ncbi:hypothetical protein DO97_05445 [Neosynechococcus sphagnicola sy1]|uniref:CHAT domain-containing protein n=1 Tax=Neosynechococcus sphagnicola sy1 TaxID=1497020 RepID=A0A098TKB2_9CYAN|nr:hypothetical protein DO97_05445 [Neosynechococcus sphagnicola sy1]
MTVPIAPLDTTVTTLDQSFTGDYESYLNLPVESPIRTLQDAQALLQDVEKETGIKPALIYVDFVPVSLQAKQQAKNKALPGNKPHQDDDQLELLLITGKGAPIRKRIPQATRAQVLALAQTFRREVSDPRKTRTNSYLPASQQLYQWIMEPLATDLQAQKVTNLSFLLDAGLRTMPLAALHNSQKFLIEQYSIGLMPSLSLTDTRRINLKQAQVLGMGISESTQGQSPLPAVPIELKTIVGRLWPGQIFLNDTATLENLKTARSRQPYSIIHLATHGDFQGGAIGNSYIQFWNQRLQMDQIRQLGLSSPPVDLLTLSACRTAVGDEQAELGFAGMAVQSGVRTAVASLWYVGDAATAALMTKFYSSLRTSSIKAEALRQAQATMAEGRVSIERSQLQGLGFVTSLLLPTSSTADLPDKELSHPYYWAAFTVVGNPW